MLGFPTINILGKVVELGPEAVAASRGTKSYSTVHDTRQEQDAKQVQHFVDYMPAELRQVFEAYHIGKISGVTHHRSNHGQRARILKISRSTYFIRLKAAEGFVERCLTLDSM